MNIQKIAQTLAEKNNLPKAIKYNLFLREYDNMVELVGLINDPTVDMRDFSGREMLVPKKWVTLDVFDANMEVAV